MDSSQFQVQILSHSDKMFRLAKSMLRNIYAAQDAVQELCLKLWEKRDHLVEVDNNMAYALRAMRNDCLDMLRSTKVNVELDENVACA